MLDVFLKSFVGAENFYRKIGFIELEETNLSHKKTLGKIALDSEDYPAYVKIFSKIIQPDKSRWYERIFQEK